MQSAVGLPTPTACVLLALHAREGDFLQVGEGGLPEMVKKPRGDLGVQGSQIPLSSRANSQDSSVFLINAVLISHTVLGKAGSQIQLTLKFCHPSG